MEKISVKTAETLLEMFEQHTRSTPEAIALELESGQSFTYAALNALAETLAHSCEPVIRATDASSPLVCVMMHRHMPLIAAMLAVLKCGAAYVPVDPSFPPDRQTHIFVHSKCVLLLADEEAYDAATSLGVSLPPAIIVSRLSGAIARSDLSDAAPDVALTPVEFSSVRVERTRSGSELMYVLYTSGSTGKPKGVAVRAIAVRNTITWFVSELAAGPHSRVLGLSTACFDISALEIFLPLSCGGTLVLVESATQRNPFRLMEVMLAHNVTLVQATPTTFEMLLVAGWKGNMDADILVGGEAFRPSLFPLLDTCKSVRNGYGPTETTIYSTCYLLPRSATSIPQSSSASSLLRVPIGAPISQTHLYLVNPDPSNPQNFTLSDREGELWIGGTGVGVGYLHAPELTAERFVTNPFGDGIAYRTGDQVERLPSGQYVFVKRLDDQVKIDGFRIELAEIENVFTSLRLVEQAVVKVISNKLVLYVKTVGSHELSAEEKRCMYDASSKQLMHYMMPKYIVQVSGFALTVTGKLDRQALPDPTTGSSIDDLFGIGNGEEDDAHEQSSSGRSMADHICDVIQVVRGRRPSPMAYFTSLGVDSLGAVLFIRNLSDTLGGFSIDAAKVYAPNVTIAALGRQLHEELQHSKPEVLVALGITRPDGEDIESCTGSVSSLTTDAEADFENGIISNMRLYEGLRGVFTFMVLWDHYHPAYLFIADAFQADTLLFVIMSGFTTAIQLREPPQLGTHTTCGILKQKDTFDLLSFVTSRAIGIFPVLLVCLCIAAPKWQENDRAYISDALQSWVRPQCRDLGANTTLYASIIWNVFLIYGLFRYLFVFFQKWIIELNKSKHPTCNRVGIIATMLAYNRPCSSVAFAMLCFSFIMVGAIFILVWEYNYFKNALAFIPYFLSGVLAASVIECVHWARWNPHLTLSTWTVDDVFVTTKSTAPAPLGGSPMSISALIWRFSPDLLAIACGFAMSSDGGGNYQAARVLTWLVVPIIVLAFIAVASLQRANERLNFSRYFLESSPMNLLGFVSYPIYLLQEVAIRYYAPTYMGKNGFSGSPLWARFIAILILIAISWFIQFFVQDILVAKAYGLYISYKIGRNNASKSLGHMSI